MAKILLEGLEFKILYHKICSASRTSSFKLQAGGDFAFGEQKSTGGQKGVKWVPFSKQPQRVK